MINEIFIVDVCERLDKKCWTCFFFLLLLLICLPLH
jgi:hypothetical protein